MPFCKNLGAKLRKALKNVTNWVNDNIDQVLNITTIIKNALQSDAAVLVTALIPGDWDNLAKTKLISVLNTAIDALGVVDECMAKEDLNEKLQCFIKELKKRDERLQNALLFKLASLLLAGMDDYKAKESFYDLYIQARFVANK